MMSCTELFLPTSAWAHDTLRLTYCKIKCTAASYISSVIYYLSLCEIRNYVRDLSPVLREERPRVYLAGDSASKQLDDRREK